MSDDPEPKQQKVSPLQSNWGGAWWWYIPIILLVLWMWQDMLYSMAVRTIPYSQFKQYLADGEVADCQIATTEINGEIKPKTKTEEINSKTKMEEIKSNNKTETTKPEIKTGEVKPETKAVKIKPKTEAGKIEQPFPFRTVRVDDPKLVDQLEAAKVEFTGIRPGFLTQFLYYWLVPIGLMVGLWVFLSRGLRAGEAVLSFGKSKARLVADMNTSVRFDDVTGCDEAKFELEEVVDFLKHPDRYTAPARRDPKGGALDWRPRNRQDAAFPGSCRGGGGAVFLPKRQRIC